MTRNEFIENVQDFGDLITFCYDEGCNYTEDIYDEEGMDEFVDNELYDITRNAGERWYNIRDILNDIQTGYGYYRIYSISEIVPLYDDDFEDYKCDVMDWGDANDVWEHDEESEETTELEEEKSEEKEEDDQPPEEGCTIEELFTAGKELAEEMAAKESEEDEEEEEDEDFMTLMEA